MEIPRHWRLKKQRYDLIGEVCSRCDEKVFPPRDVCPECGYRGSTGAEFVDAVVHSGIPLAQVFLAENT